MDASSRGPAQRRYTATVNAARHAGDLEALDVLQDALAQARRSAIDMHTPQDAEREHRRGCAGAVPDLAGSTGLSRGEHLVTSTVELEASA